MKIIFFFKLFAFVFSVLNFVFLTTSLSIKSLNLFKPTQTVFNIPTSKSSTFVFKLFKLLGILTSLLMFDLPPSAFQAIKSFLASKSDVLTPVA